jgi:uncharacterized protein
MSAPATIVRRFYEALGRGDVSAALLLLDPHVEWTEAERYPYYGGTWQGRQAVLDNLLKRLPDDWDGFSAKAEGNRVVSLGTYSGTFKNRSIIVSRFRAATSSRGSICTPTPPRCSKRAARIWGSSQLRLDSIIEAPVRDGDLAARSCTWRRDRLPCPSQFPEDGLFESSWPKGARPGRQ